MPLEEKRVCPKCQNRVKFQDNKCPRCSKQFECVNSPDLKHSMKKKDWPYSSGSYCLYCSYEEP